MTKGKVILKPFSEGKKEKKVEEGLQEEGTAKL
jgi:hypothetical protein